MSELGTHCPSCKTQIPQDVAYCWKCGQPVELTKNHEGIGGNQPQKSEEFVKTLVCLVVAAVAAVIVSSIFGAFGIVLGVGGLIVIFARIATGKVEQYGGPYPTTTEKPGEIAKPLAEEETSQDGRRTWINPAFDKKKNSP